MCASPLRGAAAPVGAAEYELRLSAFRLRHFLSFVLSVIRAEAALANASTGICLPRLRTEHRHRRFEERRSANGYVGGDGSKPWRGIARAQRRVARMRTLYLQPVILRWPRKRPSKDAAEALGPSSFEACRHGEVPGIVLRGSLRSHLRMTPGLEPRSHLRMTEKRLCAIMVGRQISGRGPCQGY